MPGKIEFSLHLRARNASDVLLAHLSFKQPFMVRVYITPFLSAKQRRYVTKVERRMLCI